MLRTESSVLGQLDVFAGRVKAAFDLFDVDGDGLLNEHQNEAMLRALMAPPRDPQVLSDQAADVLLVSSAIRASLCIACVCRGLKNGMVARRASNGAGRLTSFAGR